MQSLLPPAKLFCRAFVAALFVSTSSGLAVAQVYQSRPNGSLINSPGYVNPNFQQPTVAPQIYPGQIINGERVIGGSISTPQLRRPEAVNPPQPPVSKSDRKTQKPPQGGQQSQQSRRPDKIPRTNFPFPEGPSLQSEPVAELAPAATGVISSETPQNPESSIATEEKSEPPQALKISASADQANLPPSKIPQQQEVPTLETPDDELTLAPPEVDEDMMADIKQIRDQLGGGISETLKGIDPMPSFGPIEITPSKDEDTATTHTEASPEEVFNEQLRSVMSEQERNGSSVIGAPQTPRPTMSHSQLSYADRTEELRSCARELEQLAGRLETIEAYEHADQVRRQATDLWTTARQR